MKYILVSGGVLSGIGKGVIGTGLCLAVKLALSRSDFELSSIVNRFTAEDHGLESNRYQD